jgi:hypothetical protein
LINLNVPRIAVHSENSHVQQQDTTFTSAITKRSGTLVQLTLAFAGNTQHFVQFFFQTHKLPLKKEEGGGVRSGPGEARTILLLHIISVRPSKQPLMVRTFLKVYMELGSYFLFLQEQIKDIIIISLHAAPLRGSLAP